MSRGTGVATASPRLARMLCRWFLPSTGREFILGDLEEEFHQEILPRLGRAAARRWYWRNAISSVRAARQTAARIQPSLPSGRRIMDTALQNIRFTFRSWIRQPSVTGVALLALALGIGANSAIFSVVYSVLLNPLPYPESEQLMTVWLDNKLQGWHQDVTSFPNYEDWRDWSETFSDMAAISTRADNLTGVGDPQRLFVQVVSPTFFDVLGVPPLIGRGFSSADWDRDERVVVLSHALWQQQFGADPSVLGDGVELNGEVHTIIGVMPEGFEYLRKVDFWRLFPPGIRESSRGQLWLQVVGRLQPGVSPERAQTDMDRVGERLETEYPDFYGGYGVNVVPLHEEVSGDVRPALLVLLGAVGLVLLICCANVANLMLVRATSRRREIAVRAALGAGQGHIFGQMLTESLLLSTLGGGLGLLLAQFGIRYLRAAEPAIPRLAEIGLHGPVLLFTVVVSGATGLIFGLAPAMRAAAPNLTDVLGDRGMGESASGAGRVRAMLVVAEIALSIVLLVGAGLLLRSYAAILDVDPGFDPDGALTFRVALTGPNYQDGDHARAFFVDAIERLRALPGVTAAAGVQSVPFGSAYSSGWFTIEGRPPVDRPQLQEVKMNTVTPDYFETMRIPVLDGRGFAVTDNVDGEAAVIINDAFARIFFPDEDPIGQRFLYGIPDFYRSEDDPDPELPWARIVGVVGGVHHRGLDREIEPEVFAVFDQNPIGSLSLVVRTDGNPLQVSGPVREAIWAIDADLPVAGLVAMDDAVGNTTAPRRFNMTLLALFAAVAMILAATGIYGVMSYWVAQQTREIGVRMALGAQRRDVLRMVLRRTATIVSIGTLLGIVGGLAATRVMSSLLFGVGASDPMTFALVAAGLAIVAVAASLVPAARASGIDPMLALRDA